MCDILKPPEQVPTVQPHSSSTELVSAGAEATASVVAMMESRPLIEHPNSSNGANLPGPSSFN